MAQRLPRFIVLKSQKNDKYLIHLRDDKDYLQFSGTDFKSLHAKFEVVRSSNTVDGLVHLKCCYNKMYWVCRPDEWRISADAHEMEEDQTKTSCTLFKPVFFGTSNRISFGLVNMNRGFIFSDAAPFYLSMEHPSQEGDYLDFFDWESLPILPQYIALKGDCGNYLTAYKAPQNPATPYLNVLRYFNPILLATSLIVQSTEDENVYLRFNCKDKGDQAVGHEVFTTPDRKIRLKSNHIGKFWRLSPCWIWPDSEDDTNNNLDTLFEVTKVSHNKIALKNLGNNKFLNKLTADGKYDCLNANSSTIPETAKFLVEELVDKRNIFNVRFHEKAARIYEKEILNEVKSTDLNNTEVAQQVTMEFEYTKEESQTWTTSNSLTQTVETEITVGLPNVNVEGKISYKREVTTIVENGKTLATKQVKKFTKTVTVPPKSKVVATFRVTQALCDIPYTYSQTENFTNGTPSVTHDKDDGLYTSVCTEVYFEASQEGKLLDYTLNQDCHHSSKTTGFSLVMFLLLVVPLLVGKLIYSLQ